MPCKYSGMYKAQNTSLQNKPRYHFDSEALHVYTELKFRYGWVRDLGTVITAFALICAVNVQRER